MARTLGIPMGNIRVIRPGGGRRLRRQGRGDAARFLRGHPGPKLTGRPVMMEYTREEMHVHFRGRHKQYIDLKIGVKKDGTITAVEHKVVLDGGAYTSFGVITAYYAGSMLPTLYKIRNYRYDGTRVYTNLPASRRLPRATACRSPASPSSRCST